MDCESGIEVEKCTFSIKNNCVRIGIVCMFRNINYTELYVLYILGYNIGWSRSICFSSSFVSLFFMSSIYKPFSPNSDDLNMETSSYNASPKEENPSLIGEGLSDEIMSHSQISINNTTSSTNESISF